MEMNKKCALHSITTYVHHVWKKSLPFFQRVFVKP